MKIVFSPKSNSGNYYAEMITTALEKRGVEVYSFGDILKKVSLLFSIKVIHLNWFEDLQGESSIKIVLSFFKKVLILCLFKCLDKKIVWTMHNKMSHRQEYIFSQLLLLEC
jgi:hypothetical protein